MTTNKYFQSGDNQVSEEQDIVESNIIEMIQMSGYDCFYIPRTMFSSDTFYHEAPADKFEKSYEIEMYVNNVTDFGGNGDLNTMFGIQIDDTVEFVVSRRRFTEESEMERPLEGDLVYFPLSKHLFEIEWVEDEPGEAGSVQQFFQLGKLHTYLFKCRLFSPSYEEFDTDISEIDDTLDPDTYTPNYGNNESLDEETDDYINFDEESPFGRTT